MTSITLSLDTRKANARGLYPLRVRITHNSNTTAVSLGIYLAEKDVAAGKNGLEVARKVPESVQMNAEIRAMMFELGKKVDELNQSGIAAGWGVGEVKKYLLAKGEGNKKMVTFQEYFARYVASKTNRRTSELYRLTLNRFMRYFPLSMQVSDVSLFVIKEFEARMIGDGLSVNSRAIELRNIRAVINSAIDDEIVDKYPFRKFKIRNKAESDTMPLSIEKLRAIRDFESHRGALLVARDAFMASFYLAGINVSDLYYLRGGERCVYNRAKTGKRYDLPLQPEVKRIVERYRDDDRMFSFYRTYGTLNSFKSRMNFYLKTIGKAVGEPSLKLYHARHTYATIAYSAGISKDDIGEILGHGRRSVTDVYARYDTARIDVNHRRVLDAVAGRDDSYFLG
ncbi:MAG: site-specific integrase [Odoribacteraceae bacterium]|jgi:integrase|nr:site-specific integrase [Odoribacteraceae bacterium]